MENLKSTTDVSDTSIKNITYNVNGVSKADNGNFGEALDYFTKAIKNDPYNFISYFNRASIKMQIGDIEGARLDFKKAESLDPEQNFYS
jgi:Flp pilus assembly protein TadD